MGKTRLEAFSDGVIAILITILITIMVLELKVPHGEGLAALAIYVLAALMWLVPDRRIERALAAGRE